MPLSRVQLEKTHQTAVDALTNGIHWVPGEDLQDVKKRRKALFDTQEPPNLPNKQPKIRTERGLAAEEFMPKPRTRKTENPQPKTQPKKTNQPPVVESESDDEVNFTSPRRQPLCEKNTNLMHSQLSPTASDLTPAPKSLSAHATFSSRFVQENEDTFLEEEMLEMKNNEEADEDDPKGDEVKLTGSTTVMSPVRDTNITVTSIPTSNAKVTRKQMMAEVVEQHQIRALREAQTRNKSNGDTVPSSTLSHTTSSHSSRSSKLAPPQTATAVQSSSTVQSSSPASVTPRNRRSRHQLRANLPSSCPSTPPPPDVEGDNSPADECEEEGDDDMEVPKSRKIHLSDFSDDTRRVLRKAMHQYQNAVSLVNAFPKVEEGLNIIEQCWEYGKAESCVPDAKLTVKAIRYLNYYPSALRGRVVTSAQRHCDSAFGLRDSTLTQEEVQSLIEALQTDYLFVYKIRDEPKSGLFQNPVILSVLQDVWFDSARQIGFTSGSDYDKITLPLLALIVTAMQFSLDQWATGVYVEAQFRQSAYAASYHGHLSALKRWESMVPDRVESYLDGLGIKARSKVQITNNLHAVTNFEIPEDDIMADYMEFRQQNAEAEEDGEGNGAGESGDEEVEDGDENPTESDSP